MSDTTKFVVTKGIANEYYITIEARRQYITNGY